MNRPDLTRYVLRDIGHDIFMWDIIWDIKPPTELAVTVREAGQSMKEFADAIQKMSQINEMVGRQIDLHVKNLKISWNDT